MAAQIQVSVGLDSAAPQLAWIQNLILYLGPAPSLWSILTQLQPTPLPLPAGCPLGTVPLSYSLALWMVQPPAFLKVKLY